MSQLTDTNASEIAAEFVRERRAAGSPAMGMVMTLVIVLSEEDTDTALEAARLASREHPARVLAVILGDGRGRGQITAEVEVGTRTWTGETALLRLSGEVTKHADSVVLPLLLPDSPVVVWWASDAPEEPATDPIGQLAQRRITDAAAVPRRRKRALVDQARAYAPGSTDLAWTRLTPWRALLAAALDQDHGKITSAHIVSEPISPSAELLGAWLEARLKVPVTFATSQGPGITDVALETKQGPIRIERTDGTLGTMISPGQPDRPVALKRRELPALLAEELRHLDEDDVYAAAAKHLAEANASGSRRKDKK